MPRPRKGARLWLRPERRDSTGKLNSNAAWFILDAGKHIATGCAAGEVAAAESKLAEYIATKYAPARAERELTEIRKPDLAGFNRGHLPKHGIRCAPPPTW